MIPLHPFVRRRAAIWLLGLFGLVLTACGGLPGPGNSPMPATRVPTTIPVAWDQRASVTLIQADRLDLPLSNPEDVAFVPTCAVYGDGRVRWVEPPDEAAAAQGALGRLLESPIDRERLDSLLNVVADSGFFGLEPSYGVEVDGVRRLTIRLEGRGTHTVQVADATTSPNGFDALFELCGSLRQPDNAQPVTPEAGWLYAFPADAPGAVHTAWPTQDVPDLASLVQTARWLSGSVARSVWESYRAYGLQATYGAPEAPYYVVLRVPGITPDTPREPRNQDEAQLATTLWTADQLVRVFSAGFVGGRPTQHATIGANIVDACTIYGDGRVVISEQPIGTVQEGELTNAAIENFLDGWINSGFFEDAGSGAAPTPTQARTVFMIVSIQLNDGRTATRAFPLSAPDVTGARNPCLGITSFQPVSLVGGYVWAEEVGPMTRFEDDLTYALVQWPEDFPALPTLQKPTWYEVAADADPAVPESDLVLFAWQNLHGGHNRPNVLFVQGGYAYQVNVDVPDITTRWGGVLGAIATEEATEPPAPPTPDAADVTATHAANRIATARATTRPDFGTPAATTTPTAIDDTAPDVAATEVVTEAVTP